MANLFSRFRELYPARQMADRIGFNLALCSTWSEYGERFRDANRDAGHLVLRARSVATVLSDAELALLAAMLMAADFAWLADELCNGETWTYVQRAHGPHAEAIALAIIR